MGKFTFVGMLYVMAACSFLVGGHELFDKLRFTAAAQEAVMKSSDATLLKTAKYAPNTSTRQNVEYVMKTGTIAVTDVYLSADHLQRLAKGEEIPLKYLPSNPRQVVYPGQDMPSGAGWLVAGGVVLGIAVVAHRLLRREEGVSSKAKR